MSTMDCSQFIEHLDNWMEGERHTGAQEHTQDCASCRGIVADLDAIQTAGPLLSVGDPEPPARVWAALRIQLENEGLIRDSAGDAVPQLSRDEESWFGKLFGYVPRPALATAYLSLLKELDSWVKRKVAELPRDRRILVTSHDAFQYFAKDYGFQIDSIEGLTTDQEPSVSHVTAIIAEIKKQGVKAIFLENTLNPKVSVEITRESGAKIGGSLYADGLGPGDGETYEGMFRHNVTTIVDALK